MLINIYPAARIDNYNQGENKVLRTKNPNKNAKDWISLKGILNPKFYGNLNGMSVLNKNRKDFRLNEEVFGENKRLDQTYESRLTDNNITLPEPLSYKGRSYEPLLIKMRGIEVIKEGLPLIIDSNFFTLLAMENSNLKIGHPIRTLALEVINSYNIEKLNEENLGKILESHGIYEY
jgi:hypothetical protein